MRPFTSFLITLAIFKTVLSDCCSHVYLYSSDVIADFNQFSLGIYTYEGQFNNRPYFAKTAYVPSAPPTTVKFFLAYLDNVTIEYSGSHYSGWSVSHSLEDHNESIIMTNTTKEFELCPKGLEQGYFFYQQLDVTFSINCHEDQIKDDCDDCQVVNVNSSGALSKLYSITMGDFMRQGSFNGYPLFAKQDVLEYEGQPSFNLTSYLYFRKQGTMDDGWAIDDQLGNNTRAIITQVQKSCPQDVDRTFVIYQNAYQLDDTLKISCVIQKSVESGDEAAKEKQAEIVKSGPKSQASISLGISTAFLASLHIIFHVIVN